MIQSQLLKERRSILEDLDLKIHDGFSWYYEINGEERTQLYNKLNGIEKQLGYI